MFFAVQLKRLRLEGYSLSASPKKTITKQDQNDKRKLKFLSNYDKVEKEFNEKGATMMIVDVLLVIVSILILICVALQHSKQGLSDGLSGESSELFKQQKERGAEVVLSRLTYALSFAFIILGVIIYMK